MEWGKQSQKALRTWENIYAQKVFWFGVREIAMLIGWFKEGNRTGLQELRFAENTRTFRVQIQDQKKIPGNSSDKDFIKQQQYKQRVWKLQERNEENFLKNLRIVVCHVNRSFTCLLNEITELLKGTARVAISVSKEDNSEIN